VAVGVPAELLRRRPDIRSAELNAAAQCARIGVAKAQLYPSFSLVGTIALQAGVATQGALSKNLFSTNSLFYAIGPQINWPFFNYGRLTNGVRVEDARFQQLLVNYRDVVLRAAEEVEDALAGYVNTQEAVTLQQAAVTSAERSVQLSLVAYREGATDYQRVLDAQRSLLTQQNSLAQLTSSVATNLIALYKALGGGWEVRGGQPGAPAEAQREVKDATTRSQ
jgi:outer membrane protein TolC